MTGRDLAAVAVRVWGIILVVEGLASAPVAVIWVALLPSDPATTYMRAQNIGLIGGTLTRIAIGAALISAGDRIARWAIPETALLGVTVGLAELTRLAFSLAGVFILVAGVAEAAVALYTLATQPSWPPGQSGPSFVWEHQRDAIIRAVVQIVAGALLLFGRSGVANAWMRLRARVTPDQEGGLEDENLPPDDPGNAGDR